MTEVVVALTWSGDECDGFVLILYFLHPFCLIRSSHVAHIRIALQLQWPAIVSQARSDCGEVLVGSTCNT